MREALVTALCVLLAVLLAVNVPRVIPENPFLQAQQLVPTVMLADDDATGTGESGEKQDEDQQPDEPEPDEPQPEDPQPDDPEPQPEDPQPDGPSSGEQESDDPSPGEHESDEPSGDQTGEDSDLPTRFRCNLLSGTVHKSDLNANEELEFYAFLDDMKSSEQMSVQVFRGNLATHGQWLTSLNGRDWAAELAYNETNTIYVRCYDNDKLVLERKYTVRYVSTDATEDDPLVGENPPSIATNLDDGQNSVINTQNFVLTVHAQDYLGNTIHSNNIEVMVDGQLLPSSSGDSIYEYDVRFEPPVSGDEEDHRITVMARDGEGNSRLKVYTVTYRFAADGDLVGTLTVRVDITTLDLGIVDEFTCEILQNVPLPYTLVPAMEEQGYDTSDSFFSGSYDNGFYIRRLARAGIAEGANIPDILRRCIEADGLNFTHQSYTDSLGEFDFTQGSGWMYSVNGSTYYPGRSMSLYYPNDGDVLTLRFTLGYGKDVGGADAGSSQGLLTRYCGLWIDGGYSPDHDFSQQEVEKEATCTEPGVARVWCSRCGEEDDEIELPAQGHDWIEAQRVEPTAKEDGLINSTCSRCGETKTEILPASGGEDPDPGTEPEPQPQPQPSGGGKSTEGLSRLAYREEEDDDNNQ